MLSGVLPSIRCQPISLIERYREEKREREYCTLSTFRFDNLFTMEIEPHSFDIRVIYDGGAYTNIRINIAR